MAELQVFKSGFDGCYEALQALSASLRGASNSSLDRGADTSMTGAKEQLCYDELVQMLKDLADLADETAQDVRLTQARYALADQ